MNAEDFEGKNLAELLDMLEPVPEPPPVSMWPETEGWIWLGVCLLLLAVLGTYRWLRWRRANAYRRAALSELKHVGDDPIAIAGILRRTALAAYPREVVVALSGDDWLSFLDRQAGDGVFLSEKGRAMAAAPYRGEAAPVHGLGGLAVRWVRRHRKAVAR